VRRPDGRPSPQFDIVSAKARFKNLHRGGRLPLNLMACWNDQASDAPKGRAFAARPLATPHPPPRDGPGCLSSKIFCELAHIALSVPTPMSMPCNDEEAEDALSVRRTRTTWQAPRTRGDVRNGSCRHRRHPGSGLGGLVRLPKDEAQPSPHTPRATIPRTGPLRPAALRSTSRLPPLSQMA
jgi:hypothetical protein